MLVSVLRLAWRFVSISDHLSVLGNCLRFLPADHDLDLLGAGHISDSYSDNISSSYHLLVTTSSTQISTVLKDTFHVPHTSVIVAWPRSFRTIFCSLFLVLALILPPGDSHGINVT